MVRYKNFDLAVLAVLAVIMLATRTHSLSQYIHLPDTSLASYFVLGFLVRHVLGFVALFTLGFAIDVFVIGVLGGSSFCFTWAYWMLVPAYGIMWLAGRFAAVRFGVRISAIIPALALLVGATFVSDILSSGGFYVLSGRFENPTLAGFLPRLSRYFPSTLFATLVWSAVAAAGLAVVTTLRPDLLQRASDQ